MNATKERHSITMSPLAWTILNKLKAIQKKSISSILEESLMRMIKEEGYNATYFKIMASASVCNDEENKELTKILDSLREKDLEIAEEYELANKDK
ncbi:MAG: hypothetical protein J7J57_03110 [Caldisericaceae bacterium]|nr:hypothetical protein [Caldisericaceae bacterium]